MSENSEEPKPSTSQTQDDKGKVTCHLVAMPKLILTRIDEGNLPISIYSGPALKKPVKRLTGTKTKSLSLTASPQKSAKVKNSIRARTKPKKEAFLSKLSKPQKKVVNSKVFSKSVGSLKKPPQKTTLKQIKSPDSNTVKGMLKKTMLQKRSKIAIPPAKKPKLATDKPGKSTPTPSKAKKKVTPIKVDVPENNAMDTDTSEDEFLYDEFIEELGNVTGKKINSTSQTNVEKSNEPDLKATKNQDVKMKSQGVKTKNENSKVSSLPDVEKTKVITLKPNSGNKPPTIVKGGIVKRTNIPADLKSVASTTPLNSNKKIGSSPNSQNKSPNSRVTSSTTGSPVKTLSNSTKRASPWPISISSPTKTNPKTKLNNSKNNVLSDVKGESTQKTLKGPKKRTTAATKVKPKVKIEVTEPKAAVTSNSKIGPKMIVKVPPLSKAVVDGEESDEYTEVETLESIDSEPMELLSKMMGDSTGKEAKGKATSTDNVKKSIPEKASTKPAEEEDPNLDLLRILTDDSDDVLPLPQSDAKGDGLQIENKKSNNGDLHSQVHTNGVSDELNQQSDTVINNDSESIPTTDSSSDHIIEASAPGPVKRTFEKLLSEPENENSAEESPPVRTIYELMNDVSLQYPSWNLHIIPETNAFCIAQVTKGRLGLPTLKKCIELDPETYSAKVYIHQYHIKRFDGVYDSEETILALIEEINSIKA